MRAAFTTKPSSQTQPEPSLAVCELGGQPLELPLERRAAGRGWDVPWPLLPGHYTASVVLGDDAKPQARPTFEITAGATTRVSGPELGLSPRADAPPR